jgi:hypothetical protein
MEGNMIYKIAFAGAWLSISYLAYTFKSSNNKNKDKLKVMSVRKVLKQYKRLNDADNKSIF